MFETILNPIFNPLLKFPVVLVIGIMALIINLVITLIYKFTTDQNLMKELKDEMKELQKEMRELKKDPKRMMEVQKKAMATNMKYMSHSLRSTIFTFIPIILLFGWMNSHLAYEPIRPNIDFTTTVIFKNGVQGTVELIVPQGITIDGPRNKTITEGIAKWVLRGEEGAYILEYRINNNTYQKELLITNKQEYKPPIKKINDNIIKQIQIDHKKMKVINIFGLKLGWLASYIILSLVFSIFLRKLFKVY